MRAADVAELLKGLAGDVREFVAKSVAKVEERFMALEQRLQDAPAPITAEAVADMVAGRVDHVLGEAIEPRLVGLVERLVIVEERAPIASAPAERGAPGERGEPGPRGEPGERGIDGTPGKDVDEEALQARIDAAVELRVNAAVDKAVAAALAAIQMPKDGVDGKDGLDGEDGKDIDEMELQRRVDTAVDKTVAVAVAAIPAPKDGIDGKDGRDVDETDLQRRIDGALTKTVAEAIAAIPVPKDGVDGKDGNDGQDGRDALQIELLDAIDWAKSYPRGTYARWNGGTVRSFRSTDPLVEGEPIEKAGWSLAQDGLASIGAESGDDPRDIVFRATMTSGRTVEHPISMPTPIYHDVWTERAYRRGDMVTYDGSVWHCKRPTKAKPGTQTSEPDWTLCVKRGRAGKDGDKGLKGDRGDNGRPGRDLTQLGWDGSKT